MSGGQKSIPEVLDRKNRKAGRPGVSSEMIRAARALLRWEQRDLATASSMSLPTIKRLESKPGLLGAHQSTIAALKKALKAAGIEFIDENGGGPGVRLRKRQEKKA
jgi:transcriptional regulator with XRE-family HTH domain